MRVFVLGAGASVHAGYPLNKDLGPKLVKWAAENPPPQDFPFWIDDAELAKYGPLNDIEQVVTTLEASEHTSNTLAGLREALCAYFDSIRPGEAKLYRRFAEAVVQSGDVIITFNYDVSLDRELRRARKWEVGDGYGFDRIPSLQPSPTKLLKLHGSTNWMDSVFDGMKLGQGMQGDGSPSLGQRPVLRPQEFDFLEYPDHRDPLFKGGGMMRAGSMVLPSRDKRYHVDTSHDPHERKDFWDSLFARATTALGSADEITVIGYSLPVADERARKLLLENSNGNALLTICSGSATGNIIEQFVKAGFLRHRIVMDFKRFEELIPARCGQAIAHTG